MYHHAKCMKGSFSMHVRYTEMVMSVNWLLGFLVLGQFLHFCQNVAGRDRGEDPSTDVEDHNVGQGRHADCVVGYQIDHQNGRYRSNQLKHAPSCIVSTVSLLGVR